MDNGKGRFEMLTEIDVLEKVAESPKRTDIFRVGELVTIRDSRFKISKITPKKLILRLLPKQPNAKETTG